MADVFLFVYFLVVSVVAVALGYFTYLHIENKKSPIISSVHQSLEMEHTLLEQRPLWKNVIHHVSKRIGSDVPEIPDIHTSTITQLQDFITKMREQGYTDHKIHARLNRQGWPQDLLKKHLKE